MRISLASGLLLFIGSTHLMSGAVVSSSVTCSVPGDSVTNTSSSCSVSSGPYSASANTAGGILNSLPATVVGIDNMTQLSSSQVASVGSTWSASATSTTYAVFDTAGPVRTGELSFTVEVGAGQAFNGLKSTLFSITDGKDSYLLDDCSGNYSNGYATCTASNLPFLLGVPFWVENSSSSSVTDPASLTSTGASDVLTEIQLFDGQAAVAISDITSAPEPAFGWLGGLAVGLCWTANKVRNRLT